MFVPHVTLRMYYYLAVAVLGFDKIPLWGTFIISFGCGAISAIVIRMFVVPWQRRRIKGKVKLDVYPVSLKMCLKCQGV